MAAILHEVVPMAQLSRGESRREGLRDDDAPVAPAARPAPALLANLAVQDWFLLGYFALLTLALVFGTGPNRVASLERVGFDVALLVTGLVLTRGGVLRRGTLLHGLVYRVAIFASLQLSYFQLREILPAVSSRSVDAEILAFDLRVFGYEPAIAWDRFVNPSTTEWFAFFYFSYFFLLVAHVVPMMLADKNGKRLAHFALGAFFVFCCGHLGYIVVPGYGPYRHLAGQFDHALDGGLFWRLVLATVEAGGAQKDIFPSLHTAAPTFFAVFSFIHRRSLPFRYTWPIVGFAATQIIVATMFLRWHWVVDVIAGFALATTAALVSERIVRWEWARRARLGLHPVFEALAWPAPPVVEAKSGPRAGHSA